MKTRTCYFCPNLAPVGEGTKYIYPLPCDCEAYIHEGAYACGDCAPGVIQKLQAEGQLTREHKLN